MELPNIFTCLINTYYYYYFGTFQIFWKNPNILESPNDLKCYEWRLNDVNEYEIWKNVKYHEWLWWNCIENLYAPKDLEWPKVSQPFCRIWKKLQNMMKIELFLWLRDEMISSSKNWLFQQEPKNVRFLKWSNLPLLFSLPNGTETNGGMQLTSLQLTFSSEIIW